MTAPAESRMPLAFDSYSGLGSSYNSPASTAAFDPDFSWDPMPPHQEYDGKIRQFLAEVRLELYAACAIPRGAPAHLVMRLNACEGFLYPRIYARFPTCPVVKRLQS